MEENNMSERPHGRKRHDSGKEAEVHRRDEGLGSGPVNNSPSERPQAPRTGISRNVTRGGGLSLLALAALLLFGNGLTGGNSAPAQPQTPTQPPVQQTTTNNNTSSTNSNGYHFGTATTNNVTYTNATTPEVNTTVSSGARDKYTKLLGDGKDQVTVMVYMCGTDLESNYGMGTADLNEMAYAAHSDNVNIIVETGGTKRWKNSVISPNSNQIWRVSDRSIQKLEGNFGRKAMTDANTLAEFIQYSAKNFPANRYILIMWDHGGGSYAGYGYDELYPNGSMTVDKIAAGLKAGGVKFDIIGFDACLMANMETAIAVEPYADYLLASEETEPGTGWYHVDWLTQLAKNSSTPSLDLGKTIIDGFCTTRQSNYVSASDKYTLSIIDLAEFKSVVPEKLTNFSKMLTSQVQGNNYQTVADSRSATREFASSQKIDQIDLVHFCNTLNTAESKELAQAIQSCVKYNRTRNINNAFGISIYFPYRNIRRVSSMVQIYDNIDFNDEYAGAVKSFATLQSSGQVANNYTSSSLFDLLGGGQVSNGTPFSGLDYSSFFGQGGSSSSNVLDISSLLGGGGGVDQATFNLISSLLTGGRSHLDSSDLVLTDKNGTKVLSLSEEDWSLIQDVKLNVWVKDGDGYLNLGLDNIFEFDEDNDLLMEYDGLWVAVNDQIVSYYMTECEPDDNGNWVTRGYIPVLLNGERANLIVEYSGEEENGAIIGAEMVYEDLQTDGKLVPYINEQAALSGEFADADVNGEYEEKVVSLKATDTIDFLCEFYDLDGNYDDVYPIGSQITVGDGLKVTDIKVKADQILFGYELQDIYDSARRTPMLAY